MRKKIYLDYAATTPLDKDVLKAMLPYLKGEYGNPSSSHMLGQRAMAAIDNARSIVAGFLGCGLEEIVFTGSATEADNMAIRGVVQGANPHIITSAIEHEAVLAPLQELEAQGLAEVTYVGVGEDGIVRVEDVEGAIRKNTSLLSIMYVNSEIGTIQPIAEIGRILKKVNAKRTKKILFHTDAVQAANYLDCNVDLLGVDLLTLSAHKIYGPKGVGLLYVRSGAEIDPLIIGGGQERGMRSGTENVAGIVGFGAALLKVQDPKVKLNTINIRQMRDSLIKSILKIVGEVRLNGSLKDRLANNVSFSFRDIEGFEMVVALDQKGVSVSTGSACSERRHEPSHVLLALGHSSQEAMSSVRITLGRETSKQDVQQVISILVNTVGAIRKKKV